MEDGVLGDTLFAPVFAGEVPVIVSLRSESLPRGTPREGEGAETCGGGRIACYACTAVRGAGEASQIYFCCYG